MKTTSFRVLVIFCSGWFAVQVPSNAQMTLKGGVQKTQKQQQSAPQQKQQQQQQGGQQQSGDVFSVNPNDPDFRCKYYTSLIPSDPRTKQYGMPDHVPLDANIMRQYVWCAVDACAVNQKAVCWGKKSPPPNNDTFSTNGHPYPPQDQPPSYAPPNYNPTPPSYRPVLTPLTPQGAPCIHKSFEDSPNNPGGRVKPRTWWKINNAQDWYWLIDDNYNTGRPIEITKVANFENTYVVVLAGTEPRFYAGNQANWVNLGAWHGDLVDFFLNTMDPDWRSSQAMTTMLQVRVIQALQAAGVPSSANLILIGHSLGGMDIENLVNNPQFVRLYPNTRELITFGSPIIWRDRNGIKYLRYSSPTDPIRMAALGTWVSDPNKWIYVNNPGQPATWKIKLDLSDPERLRNQLQAFLVSASKAHLNYKYSSDLASYDPLRGVRQISTEVLLDQTRDECYEAPDNNSTTGVGAYGSNFRR